METLHFIEVKEFEAGWKKLGMDDEDMRRLQNQIMEDPRQGEKIGLVRKIRFASVRGKGKSGGSRVIHLLVEDQGLVVLISCYAKDKQANLTDEEKKSVKDMARETNNSAQRSDFMKERKK